jgi:predicted DNA-binding protein (MmcQ/YjbR family)
MEQLREFAFTFEGTTEEYSFGEDTPLFKAPNRKMFAIGSDHEDGTHVSLKLTPAEAEEALTLPFVKPAPYLARNHWVQCTVSSDVELEMTLAWVRRSHELVTGGRKVKGER